MIDSGVDLYVIYSITIIILSGALVPIIFWYHKQHSICCTH